MYDILIVGAGLAGATSARIFAEKGKKVLVVEQHKHVAGHCHDYKNEHGITVHTYGPHIFHTTNKKVWDFLNKFTDFNFYQHKVLSYANGDLIPFPINRDTLCKVYGIEIGANEVREFLNKEVEKSKYNNPPKNFKDAVVSQVGERLYEMFFKNYTIKQWERDPEELSAEIAKRIPVRENRDDRYFADKYQGIPLHGYTKMVENILDHENIAVLTGEDYFNIKDMFKPELTVYTGELDKFFDYKYGKLEYRSLDLKFKTLDQKEYQPVATVNYPNDYDWTRITEFKHFLNEKSDKTTVCFEYPKSEGEPYYIVMTEENMNKKDKYMEQVNKLEKTGKYLFIGRLAEYKYYNMDQVINAAFEKVEKYLIK
ncbi:UDP-galactopyranose mutase [Tepiditoga spiralis]|uniref:UDP-galactopyranose mutase n=1 Tax=Tepiditoga spiralis TaxID=2108365 RepID=A0A7G1GAF0_9BACT|nr:UDP-galactopyranose mutase [Tepiditoga spiralis]BBE32103.1 UDP-galactopyranose mutase [Tepiditoga spiralis]